MIYGSFKEVPLVGKPDVYCFVREYNEDKITVLVNISEENIELSLSDVGIQQNAGVHFNETELINESIIIDPWGYNVFKEKSN